MKRTANMHFVVFLYRLVEANAMDGQNAATCLGAGRGVDIMHI